MSTRVELSGLALMGILWLGESRTNFLFPPSWELTANFIALGVFLAISESADADVECFSTDSSDSNPVDFPNCKSLFRSIRR